MAAIPSIAKIAEKWQRVTPQRTQEYTDGIQNPKRDWADAAKAANASWKDAVNRAAAQDLFAKGVTKAGTAKWQENAIAKGPQRWQQGIALAGDAYATGFAPFRDAIERLRLPQRFPKRDPRNLDRVRAVVSELIKVKTGSAPAGG